VYRYILSAANDVARGIVADTLTVRRPAPLGMNVPGGVPVVRMVLPHDGVTCVTMIDDEPTGAIAR
jgi:hypothetical protein